MRSRGYGLLGPQRGGAPQVLVMESVADELVAKVKAAVDKLSVGRPEAPPGPAPLRTAPCTAPGVAWVSCVESPSSCVWFGRGLAFPSSECDKGLPVCTQVGTAERASGRARAQDNASITPVISKSSADFIEGLVKNAEDKGAKLLQPYKREGNLIWPVLVDHVTRARSRGPVKWKVASLESTLHSSAANVFYVDHSPGRARGPPACIAASLRNVCAERPKRRVCCGRTALRPTGA